MNVRSKCVIKWRVWDSEAHLFDCAAPVSGISFMQVEALDRDERGSVHAELRFSLLEQTPRIPSSQMFFIDSITGEVSLTEEGQY